VSSSSLSISSISIPQQLPTIEPIFVKRKFKNTSHEFRSCLDVLGSLNNNFGLFRQTKCCKCNICFDDRRELYRHIKAIHWLTCPADGCDAVFAIRRKLQSHIDNNHQRTENGDAKKIFSCHKCEKTFAKKRYLRAHLKRHVRPYRCDECSKRFGSRCVPI